MRTLSGPAQAKIASKQGNEPVCIIKVAWNGTNFLSYADKAYAGVEGRILSVGNIDDVRNLAGSGGNAQTAIVLDDTDQQIRALINKYDVHKVPVEIWQSFVGLSLSDAFLIFKGRAVTPITWSEGDQHVSFEATTYIESMEVGFSPDEAQFKNVSPKLINRVWPLAFGDCVHIPAVQSWERVRGTNVTGIGVPDYTLPYKYWHMVERLGILANGYEYYFMCVNVLRQLISTAPVDFDSLLDLPKNISEDLKRQAEAWERKETTISTDLKGVPNFLDRITIPQLYIGISPDNRNDLFQVQQVLNQIETSFSQVVLTEQQFKQDHEDLAILVHTLDKGIDKLQALMDSAPSSRRYLAALDGLIRFFQKCIDDRKKSPNKLVQQDIRIPTDQSTLFTLKPDEDPKISSAVQKALDDLAAGIVKLTTLRGQVAGTQNRETWRTNTETTKKAIQDILENQQLMVKSYGDSLEKIKGVKERLEIDMDNAEYGYKTINEINHKIDKLIADYHKSLKELWKIQRAIIEQGSMEASRVILSSNNSFPQGETALQIRDMVFLGEITGNQFNIRQVAPKYIGIKTAARQTNEIDAFWITDPNIILKGCYCLMTFIIGPDDPEFDPANPDDILKNRIFRVKEQYGTKCVIELVENKERQSPKRHGDQSPTLQKLPDYILDVFKDGHNHTRHEIIRILENSLEKYERERLQQMKALVEKLSELAADAPDNDRRAAANEAIIKNVADYNERINRLRFKKEAIDKCNEKLSDHETSKLLKMENLKILVGTEGVDNTPTTIAPATRMYYITGYDIDGNRIAAASISMLPSWFQYSPEGQELVDNETILQIPGTNKMIKANYLPDSSFWYAQPGSEVSIANDTTEKYIANILPSQIKGVYGRSAVNGTVQLIPIPRSLYEINEADTSYQNPSVPTPEFAPLAVTSLTFKQPLSAYNLGFQNDVYVSLRSSVGPNTCSIIQWIVETWTSLTIDTASFTAVGTKLANYPQNFCLTNKQDALKLIEQIAWENRCAIFVRNEVVYIQYMAEDQTPVDTITETDVEEGSLSFELTSTEDIATKVVAKWKPDYAMQGEDTIILRYNIRKYGLFTRTFNFETFNIFALIYKSMTFWMIRYANSWKRVKFKTYLHKLQIETFDWITLNFSTPYFSSGPIDALVEKADYDSASQTMSIQCWVPIRSGELTKYQFAMPAGLSSTVLFPPAEDIVLGLAGNYQNSATPTNIPFRINPNVNLIEAIQLRPKDYGDPFPGDTANLLPPSPLEGLSLQDFLFNPSSVTNYNTPNFPRTDTINSGRPDAGQGRDGQNQSPQRDSFFGRIVALVDRDGDEYLVRSSENYQYSATCLTPSLGRLRVGDAVYVVRDRILNKYIIVNARSIMDDLEYYVVREEWPDYVLCAKFDYESLEDPDEEEEEEEEEGPILNPVQLFDKDLCSDGGLVAVAKPRILQATPFDAQVVEYPDVKVVYKYDEDRVGRRTAQVYDGTRPEDIEKITPPYYPGDIITVRKGTTGLLDGDDEDITLIDTNEGGRAWAKVVEDVS